MIVRLTHQNKMAINFKYLTFLSKVASGMDRPTVAIINAMAALSDTPISTKNSINGRIPATLAYIGKSTNTAIE